MPSNFKVFTKKTSPYEIEAIIKSSNIIEVARELGIKVNKNVIPCIKQHNHVNKAGAPTMSFNVVNGTFRCWVCPDVGGSVVDLVMQVKNVDESNAIQYLAIRGEADVNIDKSTFFTSKTNKKLDPASKEEIYKQFFEGLDNNNKSIDLIAFASTKGGTGKSLVANNISVLISLVSRYISMHRENSSKMVEIVDLDFGKPDQRILFNREPEHYIEDMFYYKDRKLDWQDIREVTPIENLCFVSPCPVRKSNSLYYLSKNEILYMLHNSDSLIKFADFGGGANKDTLDFLSNIKSKIFVINPDKTSVEAVFNLILSLIYYPLKQNFREVKEVIELLEQLRRYQQTGFTVNDFRNELNKIERAKYNEAAFKSFHLDILDPFKKYLEISHSNGKHYDVESLKKEVFHIGNRVDQIMFTPDGSDGSYSYTEKSKIYKQYNFIRKSANDYLSYSERLENVLRVSLFGLIVNKAKAEEAIPVKDDLIRRVENAFTMKLTYLGNVPDEDALKNVSNYDMPFVIANINHPVVQYFCSIADNIIGLKHGSTERIINEQKDYIFSLKSVWEEHSKTYQYH